MVEKSGKGGGVVMRFKSCPRCKGDVIIDRDQYGWYEQCIQCGYISDLKNMAEVRQLRVKVKKRKPPETYDWDV